MTDDYVYQLEQVLTKLLDFFEPGTDTYTIYDDDDIPFIISMEMSEAVDHANDVLYGEGIADD